MSSLAAPGNTPSLDEVREKIERRYANAMGRAELASNSVEGRMLEVQKSTLDMAGVVPAGADPGQHGRREAGRQAAGARGRAGADTRRDGKEASVARLDEIRASMAKDQQPSGDSTAAS